MNQYENTPPCGICKGAPGSRPGEGGCICPECVCGVQGDPQCINFCMPWYNWPTLVGARLNDTASTIQYLITAARERSERYARWLDGLLKEDS